MNINFVYFESLSGLIPKDYEEAFRDVKWDEVSFMTEGINETNLMEYEITDDEKVYLRGEDGGIEEKELTADLTLIGGLVLEKYDYAVFVKALFCKGEMRELSLDKIEKVDYKERVETQEKFAVMLERAEKMQTKWWYKLFALWRGVVGFMFSVIRVILGFLIKMCWKIQNALT